MNTRNLVLVLASLATAALGFNAGCGDDEGGGSGGASTGGAGGTSGTGGSTGGASGSGGGGTGGVSGGGGTSGSGGTNTGGTDAGSDSSAGGSDSGSGGADAGACTQPPDAGAACNTVVNGASFVTITQVASTTPTGTGGTIADGHYFMTKLEGYTGNGLGSLTMKQTLDLCAGVGQLVGEEKGPVVYHKIFTLKTSGTGIDATGTCSTQSPNVDVKYSSYTATPTAFTLYSTALSFSVTYTKQ